jgi:phenylalanyl-tRNA synthetase alpha chain
VKEQLANIRREFEQDIQQAKSVNDIEAIHVKFLGKKGPITQLMKVLKEVPPEQRPEVGKWINELKIEITEKIESSRLSLVSQEESHNLLQEKIDVTLPGRRHNLGRKHILIKALDEVIDILIGMGFSVQYGPDIDSDYYNFEALNFPADHPARDMQDTFYIGPKTLLRTQTSNIQARVMEAHKPPIRIISPGVAYRNEAVSARSHVFFHQVEALYINKGINFADLLRALDIFLNNLFGFEIEKRYRPSYFPFVEPGMEVDIRCMNCGGSGCNICKHTGWLEVAGAGMVHPEVLKNGGIDPEEYSGYAWGLGIERLVMTKYQINDIRFFTQNDLRFLSQFHST